MSRLSLGSRTQFLHILLTKSSLKMMISWLQYWTLKKFKKKQCSLNFQSQKATKGLATTANLPAWICGEHRKRHPLSELFCDVIHQWRPEEERFFHIW